ncbi:MAG: stage III sporulation AC/AD family protein [Eubacterium sp.]|nr:stage III sporulation AC/AD family protein [Eubacterium sp.]
MDIFKITAVGLAAAVFSVMLKEKSPQTALAVSAVGCIVILFAVLPKIEVIFQVLKKIEDMIKGEGTYVKLVLKIAAVGYISSFGGSLCRDFGESALGEKIELGGKVVILLFSLPVITGLLDMLNELMP